MAPEQKIVARDFLGLGTVGNTPEAENSGLETRNEAHPGKNYSGMSLSMWNTTATMQQRISLRNLQEGTSVDQNLSHPLPPDHNQQKTLSSKSVALDHNAMREEHGDNSFLQSMGYSFHGNHATGGHFMALARRYGNLPMGIIAQALEPHNSSSNFAEAMPKTMLSFSLPNLKDQVFLVPAFKEPAVTVACDPSPLHRSVEQFPLPGSILSVPLVGDNPPQTKTRMLSSDFSEKQSSAQLTIFYAGNVNVYNDISHDKAQAIMHLAASGGSCPTKKVNEPAGKYDEQFGLINVANSESAQVAADRASQNSPPATKQAESSKPIIPCAGQPVVIRALPQARKASLARFLEKRKERVQAKSPYSLTKPFPEQSLLPGERFSSSNNDPASPTPWDECVDKKPVPMSCWMEEVTSTAAKGETGFGVESRMVGEGETNV